MMRRLIVVLLFIGALAAPAAAQLHARLPYSLTFYETSSGGRITGAWGGTPVQGAYADGQWVIVSGGVPVASGTYRCDGGCTFEGVAVYETATRFTLNVPPLQDSGFATVSGSLTIDLTPPTLE
jgi:hypothetical protein